MNHPPLSNRSTECTRQDLEMEHSILLSVTHMLCVSQVCHGVSRCVKDGNCSSSILEWTSMDSINGTSYYLNKCWMLSNTSQMTIFFSFRKTAHRCIVRVMQSNWVKMWFLCFPVLPGSAEAHVIWGGIVKRIWLPTLSVTFLPKI